MHTNISVRKNWAASLELMIKRPIILLPFFIIAFFEGIALELIYFSARKPLVLIAGPVIRKLSGPRFLHYPFNFIKIPDYFFYTQLIIYILIGAFLTAISINIIKNIKTGLPLKTNALIKNALNRYLSFIGFGLILVTLLFLLKKADVFIISKLSRIILRRLPNLSPNIFSIASEVFFFFTNVIMYAFIVLALPIIVTRKSSLLKALLGSIGMGFRHFFSILALIFVPFLIYFPVTLLKGYATLLASKTFPEIVLLILGAGTIIGVFIDCFIFVCATQFVLEREK